MEPLVPVPLPVPLPLLRLRIIDMEPPGEGDPKVREWYIVCDPCGSRLQQIGATLVGEGYTMGYVCERLEGVEHSINQELLALYLKMEDAAYSHAEGASELPIQESAAWTHVELRASKRPRRKYTPYEPMLDSFIKNNAIPPPTPYTHQYDLIVSLPFSV